VPNISATAPETDKLPSVVPPYPLPCTPDLHRAKELVSVSVFPLSVFINGWQVWRFLNSCEEHRGIE
jgi:hypothetical protein